MSTSLREIREEYSPCNYKYYDDGLFEEDRPSQVIPCCNGINPHITVDMTQTLIIQSLQNIKISNSPQLPPQAFTQQQQASTEKTANTNPQTPNDSLNSTPLLSEQEDLMIEDDDNFEYNDELNFLISNFDLAEEKKTSFMPYIY